MLCKMVIKFGVGWDAIYRLWHFASWVMNHIPTLPHSVDGKVQLYFMHDCLTLKVIKWKEKYADTEKQLSIVQESANILARAKVCIYLYHTCSSVHSYWFRESSLLSVMPCPLSHSIVKVILEAKMAEMEANYKKACKKHALATYVC